MLVILIMKELSFLCKKKILARLKYKMIFVLTCLVMKMSWFYPIFISKQKFESSMDILLLIKDDQSHYVYIKDFNTFMFHKTKNKNKKWFCKSGLQCFSK